MNTNKEQLKASHPSTGIHLVLAGAGTGKTTTMIERIANTMECMDSENKKILVLTFSKKAALEIQERLSTRVKSYKKRTFTGTIHSFCFHLISKYADKDKSNLNLNQTAQILSDQEEKKLLMKLYTERKETFMGLPFKVIVSCTKKFSSSRFEVNNVANLKLRSEIQAFIGYYIDTKKKENKITFQDIICNATELLRKNKNIRNEIHSEYESIFIDEFQDTSIEDYNLVKLLINPINPRLFMVGDDYQSIYGFRGGDPSYIIKPNNYFNKVKIHKLKKNYRSRKEIIQLAEKIIKKNKNKSNKKLISLKGKGGKIKIIETKNPREEIESIRKIIFSSNNKDSIAVLTRNNNQSNFIREEITTLKNCSLEIMTIHKSKGLEFNEIIIAGISDKTFPSPLSELEEERRLLFVAITRAREKISIIYYKNKNTPLFIKELTR